MRSSFKAAFILFLLSHLSISAWAEKPSSHCWFDTSVDTQVEYGETAIDSSFCPAQLGPYETYIGSVSTDDGMPECYYVSQLKTDGYLETFRWLNTDYEKLASIIKREGQNGLLHETMEHFVERFPACNTGNQGHSLAHSSQSDDTGVQQYSQQEICLKVGKNINKEKAVIFGYWSPNVRQCITNDESPYYVQNAKPAGSAQGGEQQAQSSSQKSTKYRAADHEFVCDGFVMDDRGWAGRKYFGGLWDKDNNCNKYKGNESEENRKAQCCKFAQNEGDCDHLSWDPSGKCCCGPDMDYGDRGKHSCNIGLKRKR